jgi:hypothetical protein
VFLMGQLAYQARGAEMASDRSGADDAHDAI